MATLTQGDAADLRRALATNQIITGALGASVFAYVGIGLLLEEFGTVPIVADDHARSEQAQWVTIALGVAAAACVAAAPIVARAILRGASGGLGPDTGSDLQGRVRAYARAYQTATIVRAALGESVAVFGLVLFILYGKLPLLLGFAAVGLLGVARAWPTWRAFSEGLKAVAPSFPGWDQPPARRRPEGGAG